jgi:hypothetical protein
MVLAGRENGSWVVGRRRVRVQKGLKGNREKFEGRWLGGANKEMKNEDEDDCPPSGLSRIVDCGRVELFLSEARPEEQPTVYWYDNTLLTCEHKKPRLRAGCHLGLLVFHQLAYFSPPRVRQSLSICNSPRCPSDCAHSR